MAGRGAMSRRAEVNTSRWGSPGRRTHRMPAGAFTQASHGSRETACPAATRSAWARTSSNSKRTSGSKPADRHTCRAQSRLALPAGSMAHGISAASAVEAMSDPLGTARRTGSRSSRRESTSGNWATAWCGYCSATTRSTSRSWVWARAASGSRCTTCTCTSGCRRASRPRACGSRAEAAVWKMARRTLPAGSSWVLCSAVTARSISCRIRSVCSISVLACGVSTRARPRRCTRGTPHSRARVDSCWETAEGV